MQLGCIKPSIEDTTITTFAKANGKHSLDILYLHLVCRAQVHDNASTREKRIPRVPVCCELTNERAEATKSTAIVPHRKVHKIQLHLTEKIQCSSETTAHRQVTILKDRLTTATSQLFKSVHQNSSLPG